MNADCCYILEGEQCQREATTSRIVPLRSDPPCPDWLIVSLCYWHSQAVSIWQQGRATRRADMEREARGASA